MKKWLGLVGAAIAVFLFIFFVGTKPAPEAEKQVEETQVKIGKQWEKPPVMQIDVAKQYTATIETSKGTIRAGLFTKETPNTVNNFVFLTREKFYDGVKFHRIIKDFMIQTGDPKGDGSGGPGYAFGDEPITKEYKRGTLAMANRGPNTQGSQFFIIHNDYDLPKNYTIFGAIDPKDTESLRTLDTIAETPVELNSSGESSKPKEMIIIVSVAIEEK